jgi:hypothetical protein
MLLMDITRRIVDPSDRFIVFCAACERRAEIIAYLPMYSLQRPLHVRCHGVERLISVFEMTEHVALVKKRPVAVLWEATDDWAPDEELVRMREQISKHFSDREKFLLAIESVLASRGLEKLTAATVSAESVSKATREHRKAPRRGPRVYCQGEDE